MKKEYVKPYLALESFQLVAALAGSCQNAINHSIDECNGNEEDLGVFFGNSCDIHAIIDGKYTEDGVCYHGFDGLGNYLTS